MCSALGFYYVVVSINRRNLRWRKLYKKKKKCDDVGLCLGVHAKVHSSSIRLAVMSIFQANQQHKGYRFTVILAGFPSLAQQFIVFFWQWFGTYHWMILCGPFNSLSPYVFLQIILNLATQVGGWMIEDSWAPTSFNCWCWHIRPVCLRQK